MKDEKISESQKKILEILWNGSINQADLTPKLKKNRTTVWYHLNKLEEATLIHKVTVREVGGVKINEISLNKLSLHRIRKILGMKNEGISLITGWGALSQGYRIPDISYQLLQNELKEPKIDKIICFTTPDSLERRREMVKKESLIPEHELEIYTFDYPQYRNFESVVYKNLYEIIQREIEARTVFLDLTPLSKLFSFKLLEYSHKYNIPSFYLGKTRKNEDTLVWFLK